MSLTRLIDALNAGGLWPTSAELADALWLAQHRTPERPGSTPLVPAAPRSTSQAPPGSPPVPTPVPSSPPDGLPPAELHAQDEETVYAAERPSSPVRTPAVATLPAARLVMRGMRPLKRSVPSRRDTELDEEATAYRFAETGRWHPVRRPVRTRWLDLAIIVDADPSMVIWQQLVDELCAVIARLGAFRDIRRWFLHHHEDRLRLSPSAGTSFGLREPTELIDPTGRRMILLVSSGIGPAWHTGAVAPLLDRYGRRGPTAVLQPLPQRLWDRTALRARLGRARPTQPGSANSQLRYAPRGEDDGLADGEVPVPVLEINPAWIREWTRLVTATAATDVAISTIVPSSDQEEGGVVARPVDRITRFRRHASPQAFELLRHLAVVPLSIPVMRLVQHATSHDPDPAHLAEVYLSGLLEQVDTTGADRGVVTFDFTAGVRNVLLGTLRKAEAARVLEAVADLLGVLPHGDHDFVAHLPTDRSAGSVRLSAAPFASVARHVLRRMHPASAPANTDEQNTPEPARRDLTLQPAIWGAVPLRNPDFVGRSELHNRLSAMLGEPGEERTLLPVVLHGMGGIGKSNAVVEYIYRQMHEYNLVWWIPSEHPTTIRSSFVELAKRMGIKAKSAEKAVPAVLDALRDGTPNLRRILVFDNADAPDVIQEFLPEGPGHVVVTSRNPGWAGVARGVEVELFSREESKEFLHRRGIAADEDTDRLADALGDLPLAVAQAAVWCAQTGMQVAEYIELLGTHGWELLNAGSVGEYELPVTAAWNVSFNRMKNAHPDALELLRLLAFFGSAPIPRAWLSDLRGASVPAVCTDPLKMSRAIREISRYSLATVDYGHDTLQLHQLVGVVLRAQLDRQHWDAQYHAVHQLLADNVAPGSPEDTATWATYAELLPHAIASNVADCQDDRVRALYANLVRYLEESGSGNEARRLAEQAASSNQDR